MLKHKKAVTLAELVIVTIILMILWTVWFSSYTSYLANVRDSNRLVEIWNIESALEFYMIKSSTYPDPENSIDITYSWSLVWKQWLFWDSISNIIWYSKGVRDPLTDVQYTYSLKNTKKEFSIAWVLEDNPWLFANNNFVWDARAEITDKINWLALVKWNYNWVMTHVNDNWNDLLLIVPSIVATDLSTSTDLEYLMNNNKLVYDWYKNLPYSYTGTSYNLDNNIDFSPEDIVVFSWSLNSLVHENERIALLYNIQKSYSWAFVDENSNKFLNNILNESIDLIFPESTTKDLSCDLINNKLNYNVDCENVIFSAFYVVDNTEAIWNIDFTYLSWVQVNYIYQNGTNLWFWTTQWIYSYSFSTWSWTQYPDTWSYKITVINTDLSWNVWFWTSDSGLLVYDWTDFINYQSDYDPPHSNSNHFYPSSNNWIPSNAIYDIVVEPGWNLLIWTHNWWSYYNSSTNTFDDFYVVSNNKHYLYSQNRMKSFIIDSNNNLWIWTDQWLYLYEWSISSTPYWYLNTYDWFDWLPYKGSRASTKVTYLYEDTLNNIWVWTVNWIWKINSSYNVVDKYTTKTWEWLANNVITSIFEDYNTWKMWFWTQSWVSVLSGSTFTNYSKDINWSNLWVVYFIYQDENWLNILWTSNWTTSVE